MKNKNTYAEFEKLYKAYILSKADQWSPSTIRAEGFRLKGISMDLVADPKALHKYLEAKSMKPYAIKTSLVRAADFVEWLILEGKHVGPNLLRAYMRKNANAFKGAYVRSVPKDSIQDAVRRIAMMPDDDDQKKALQLLSGALRFHESTTIDEDGTVLGKGGKRREVGVMPELLDYTYPRHYISFVRALKQHTGYKPHDLRKIAAMEAARQGATIPQLMAVLGHTSTTAVMAYVQAADAERLNQSRNDTITNTLKTARGAIQDGKQVSRTVSKSKGPKPVTGKSNNS